MPEFKRKNIRLKDFDYSSVNYAYFVTICINEKEKDYLTGKLADIITANLNVRIENNEVILFRYCIMPNHLHLLFSLNEEYQKSLSVWVSSFKRLIAKEAKEEFGIINLWQRNYYDHIVRSNESISNIAEYILNNPVRKGFVERWEDYSFCKICV